MDAVKSDANGTNVEVEIEKTTKRIQKLCRAEQSVDRRRKIILVKIDTIYREINKSRGQELRRWIDELRMEIISLEQFPRQPSSYHCTTRTRIRTANCSPSLTPKEQAEEAMRKLNSQFQHNNKNLATERMMGREIRKHQRTMQQQPDHAEEAGMDTNPYYIPLSDRHWYHRLKPLPTEDIQSLISIWAEKIEDASNRLLRDSKSLTVTPETYDKLEELWDFGRQFYWQVDVGREDFKRHWDSRKHIKSNIAKIEFDLIKAIKRHERGYAKLERSKENLVELEKHHKVMLRELRNIGHEKSATSKYILQLQMKQTDRLRVI